MNYIIALGIIVLGALAVLLLKRVLLRKLRKWTGATPGKTDDFLVRGIQRSLIPLLYIGLVYAVEKYLTFPPKLDRAVEVLLMVCITFFVIRMIVATLKFLFVGYLSRQDNGGERVKQVRGIMLIVAAFIWMLGILFLLDNWGVDVTTFLAGLGIGGIAIALAAQTILGDLFSYFVIFFDRPFEIGDFIVVQDKAGAVEYIGIKTTRLRSITGEQLVFSNTDLTNSRVHNYKRMARRRIVFKIGVTYQTPAEKLALIPGIIKDIITSQPDLQFDRAHFLSFGDSQLDYEVVYFVLSADFNKYMDNQQAINLALFEAFEQEGIEFAYPTQTLFISKEAV